MWNTLNTLNSLVSEGVKELASEVRQGVAQVSKGGAVTSSFIGAPTHTYAPTINASKVHPDVTQKMTKKHQNTSMFKVEICAF